jgi:DNA-binding beta-propeller fold protein YncE
LQATLVPVWGRLGLLVAAGALVAVLVFVTQGVGEAQLRAFRLFDVLMVLGTLTLPLASALVMKYIFGVNMNAFYPAMMALDFAAVPVASLIGVGASLILMFALAIGLGLWWDARRWPLVALVHYSVFFILFSTMLTYGWGVLTGLVGGLAYWMAQQGVERGSQPWYYYGLIGPLYEYMPILISLVGGGWLAGSRLFRGVRTVESPAGDAPEERGAPFDLKTVLPDLFPFFLLAWAALSWVAYIFAGEKMPWLFVHIAFPHILMAAWTLDRVFRGLTWRSLFANLGWAVPLSLVLVGFSWAAFRNSSGAIRQALQQSGATEGLAATVAQLEPLGRISGGVIGILLFSGVLLWALNRAGPRRSLLLVTWTLVVVLAVLTLRTAVMLNVINDEMATEYMVYAHGTPDVKEVLSQIEAISWRLTGTPDEIQVAYSKDVAWPFYWYMYAHYPNNYYFETPEAERLLASPVILAAPSEWEMVEEIVGETHRAVDYKHIWWPVEDYKDLTWARLRAVLTEPERRRAVWDIIWRRDYRRYARLRDPENPFTLRTWPHRLEFRFYVREDLAERVWDYQLEEGRIVSRQETGANLLAEAAADPYQEGERPITATLRVALPHAEAAPRGLAAAGDGTLYVADAALHRIWQVTADGVVSDFWGDYGVAMGQFHTPWDLALDDEGALYVADTWNHRIQKMARTGALLATWGRLVQVDAGDPTGQGGFYGPRGVAVAPDGRIYVADAGNHRIQVFDTEGAFLLDVGGGMGAATGEAGLLREPSGLAFAPDGTLFVADAWNRRVLVFDAAGAYLREWEVPVWGQGRPDDRPQLAWADGRLFATDPAHQRVLVFDADGVLLTAWEDAEEPLLPGGLAVADGMLYVTNLLDAQIVGYPLP